MTIDNPNERGEMGTADKAPMDEFFGIMSPDTVRNLVFASYNRVRVDKCSFDRFQGRRRFCDANGYSLTRQITMKRAWQDQLAGFLPVIRIGEPAAPSFDSMPMITTGPARPSPRTGRSITTARITGRPATSPSSTTPGTRCATRRGFHRPEHRANQPRRRTRAGVGRGRGRGPCGDPGDPCYPLLTVAEFGPECPTAAFTTARTLTRGWTGWWTRTGW